MSAHHCHALGCTKACAPERLFCPAHWFEVPSSLQDAVWASYREGQCDDKNPSKDWHQAADAAIGFLATKEFRPISKAQLKALKHFGWTVENTRLVRAP